MARLRRPLDREAVREADDRLYAEHADDERPNALYDEDGNRLPLDPDDPDQGELRSEWVALYEESLAGDPASPPPPPPPDSGSSDERPVADPVEPCTSTHDIVFAVAPRDLVDRPGYWPALEGNPYAGEGFTAQLTNGERRGKLDSSGGASFSGIPHGACQFTMGEFFKKIAEQFERGVVFPPK